MEIIFDTQTLTEAGFNVYLARGESLPSNPYNMDTRTIDPTNIVGGVLGNEGIIYVGCKQISINGRTRTITVEDGAINILGGGGITVTDSSNTQVITIDKEGVTVSDGTNTGMITIDSEGLTLNDGSYDRVKIGNIG